jgi:hypothetical protein
MSADKSGDQKPPSSSGSTTKNDQPRRKRKRVSRLTTLLFAVIAGLTGYGIGNVVPVKPPPTSPPGYVFVLPSKPDAETVNRSSFGRILNNARQTKASVEATVQKIVAILEGAGAIITPEVRKKIEDIVTKALIAVNDEELKDAIEALIEVLNALNPSPTPTPMPSPTPIIRMR